MKLLLALALGLSSPLLSAPAFTFEDLRALIETQKLTRIEDVVEKLPAEYRQNYTLMRESRSLQGASPDFPRTLLFGKDASLILAFSGNPQLNGYDALEVIQYRKDTHRFEFRRVTFFEGETSKAPEFSDANPGVCMGCHTSRLRPNWERYPEWPGAYGSFDDVVQAEQLTQLKTFWETNGKQGRYQALTRLPGSEASPYETKSRGRVIFRPNFRLASALFAH